MAGGKRNKSKKALAPVSAPSSDDLEDNELVDDLLAKLDVRDATVQRESVEVLSELEADQDQKKLDGQPKNNSKARHKARAVSV
jgi:OTU domain-containing protein 6